MSRSKYKHRKCYMCDEISVSREHFPPKCFFPENYRVNLFTVPSCEEHNSGKSKDDLYLLLMFYSYFKNDRKIQRELTKSAEETVQQNPNLAYLFSNPHPLAGEDLIAFEVDQGRINTELEHIARAAYYYKFHEHWPHPLNIVCTALIPTPANGLLQAINANRGLRELDQAMEIFFQKVPKEGNENNRLVFYYQISKSDENSLFIKMVFLNGINVFAYYK